MILDELMNSRLISFSTTDGLKMKGYLAIAEQNLATIIHIHGSCGNFYENDFMPYMAGNYTAKGINFLTVNNRGHDCMAEVYRNRQLEYIGGYHEIIEECLFDIEGAIRFAEGLGAPIILQGHSLGCLKVLMYLVETKKTYNFILLSPSDSFQLQADYIYPETIEDQVARIKETYKENLNSLLPAKEFGIKEKDVVYYIPTTPKNLLSLFGSSKTRLLAYRSKPEYFINAAALIYYGGSDRLQTEELDNVQKFFESHALEASIVYHREGDHHFHGYEDSITTQIAKWASKKIQHIS